MKAKEIVQTLFPEAKIEIRKTSKSTKFWVRNGGEYFYFSYSFTEEKAWEKALPVAVKRAAKAVTKPTTYD